MTDLLVGLEWTICFYHVNLASVGLSFVMLIIWRYGGEENDGTFGRVQMKGTVSSYHYIDLASVWFFNQLIIFPRDQKAECSFAIFQPSSPIFLSCPFFWKTRKEAVWGNLRFRQYIGLASELTSFCVCVCISCLICFA